MMLRKYYILFILMHLYFAGYAQTPKYSNEYLNIGADARALSMGRTVVANVNDMSSGYWNPAGLTKIEDNIEITAMHSNYFSSLSTYNYGSFAYNIDKNSAFAFSFVRFAIDNLPNTTNLIDAVGNINYNQITNFSVADYGFFASYAKKNPALDGMSLGGSAKIIYRQAGDFARAFGVGFDFGIQYESKKWQYGLLLKDATSTFTGWSYKTSNFDDAYILTDNEIPQNGLDVTLPRLILGAAKKHEINSNTTILAEANLDITFDGKRNVLIAWSPISIDPHFGFELGYLEKIYFRAGLGQFQRATNLDGLSKTIIMQPNLGIGVQLNEFKLDYALANIGDNGVFLSHVFSIKVAINSN